MKNIAVIIPVYNEETTICDTLSHMTEVLHDSFKGIPDICIYVYDNNSTDKTCKEVTTFISERNIHNIDIILASCLIQGKGATIRQAFKEVDAHCYCMIDGDNTYDASMLRTMYDMIISGQADMVIGDRLSTNYLTENKRRFHSNGNLFVTKAVNKLFDTSYKDVLSGLRVFSYAFVKTFPATSDGFTLETELALHAATHDIKTTDIPCNYHDRKKGSESKLNTIPDGIRILSKIGTTYCHNCPFQSIGIPGLILMLLGVILTWITHLSGWTILYGIMITAGLASFALCLSHTHRHNIEQIKFDQDMEAWKKLENI